MTSVCGRFSLAASGEELAEAFGLEDAPEVTPRYNIAPSQPVIVVRSQRGRRAAARLRWGLPVEGPQPELLINARSETAATRPAFREAYRRRRCLVPADGFYEWKRGREGPRPFHLRRPDRRLLAFAGLWIPAAAVPGTEPAACVILTTAANGLVAPIHDRMPVIVPPEAYELWLSGPAPADPGLETLLRPCPESELEAVAVSAVVNSAASEGPQCQEPAAETPRQGLLFPEM